MAQGISRKMSVKEHSRSEVRDQCGRGGGERMRVWREGAGSGGARELCVLRR